jgi:hypothetical protein
VCLRGYGGGGLALFLGGTASHAGVLWDSLALYDAALDAWYNQTTTGPAPVNLRQACTNPDFLYRD